MEITKSLSEVFSEQEIFNIMKAAHIAFCCGLIDSESYSYLFQHLSKSTTKLNNSNINLLVIFINWLMGKMKENANIALLKAKCSVEIASDMQQKAAAANEKAAEDIAVAKELVDMLL